MNFSPILQIIFQAIGLLVLSFLLIGFFWAIDAGKSEEREHMQPLRDARRQSEAEHIQRLQELDPDQIPMLHFQGTLLNELLTGKPGGIGLPKLMRRSGPHGSDARGSEARRIPERSVGERQLRGIGGLVALLAVAVLLSACNFPEYHRSEPTPDVLNTTTPVTSISGLVFNDSCENTSLDQPAPTGCVGNTNTGRYIANGTLDPGESGLPGVIVSLGLGACPAKAFRETKTDAHGRFTFSDLPPYEYCIFANTGENPISTAQESGIWTSPPQGMLQITLEPGQLRSDLMFGWDRFTDQSTPTPEPTKTTPPVSSCVDSAGFVKDVTLPDGTYLEPGKSFSKTWRLRNNGTCPWTREYDLVFVSGYLMEADRVVPLTGKIEPGQTVDVTVSMRSPKETGSFWGYWMLRNSVGESFGIGDTGRSPFWVKISVAPKITEWRGAYYNNRTLSGDAVLIRNDEKIDFDWRGKSPAKELPSDHFSARWTRSQDFNAAIYRFSVLVDDGARLYVDDRLVLDEWEDGSARTVSVDLLMNAGKHDLKLEFFEREGDARIRLEISKINPQPTEQWVGRIWTNRKMDSPWALVRISPTLDFNWGEKSPGLGVPADDFSALWTQIHDFKPGTYRFQAQADDGVRVKIDDKVIIDRWHASSGSEIYQAEVELSGNHQIDVSYFEQGGSARIHVWWDIIDTPNDPPVATMDDYETIRGVTLYVPAPGVLSNDDDPEGAPLKAVLVSPPSNGRIELNLDGSLTYVPDGDFVGEDSFTYHVDDGGLLSNVVPVIITIVAENAPPVVNDDEMTSKAGKLIEVAAPGVLSNDYDPDGDAISAELVSPPENGEVFLQANGSFHYQAAPDFKGVVQFMYRATDG